MDVIRRIGLVFQIKLKLREASSFFEETKYDNIHIQLLRESTLQPFQMKWSKL